MVAKQQHFSVLRTFPSKYNVTHLHHLVTLNCPAKICIYVLSESYIES